MLMLVTHVLKELQVDVYTILFQSAMFQLLATHNAHIMAAVNVNKCSAGLIKWDGKQLMCTVCHNSSCEHIQGNEAALKETLQVNMKII